MQSVLCSIPHPHLQKLASELRGPWHTLSLILWNEILYYSHQHKVEVWGKEKDFYIWGKKILFLLPHPQLQPFLSKPYLECAAMPHNDWQVCREASLIWLVHPQSKAQSWCWWQQSYVPFESHLGHSGALGELNKISAIRLVLRFRIFQQHPLRALCSDSM